MEKELKNDVSETYGGNGSWKQGKAADPVSRENGHRKWLNEKVTAFFLTYRKIRDS